MRDVIDEFDGKYSFLSNFYPAPVDYQGYHFENSEAAYQASKCPDRMLDFCGLPPNRAKRLGRKVPMRPDWELVKYDVMYEVCMAKFTQNPDLLSKLLATGDAELIEGNTWGDRHTSRYRRKPSWKNPDANSERTGRYHRQVLRSSEILSALRRASYEFIKTLCQVPGMSVRRHLRQQRNGGPRLFAAAGAGFPTH